MPSPPKHVGGDLRDGGIGQEYGSTLIAEQHTPLGLGQVAEHILCAVIPEAGEVQPIPGFKISYCSLVLTWFDDDLYAGSARPAQRAVG